MLSKVDTIILILLVVSLSYVFGMNIISLIDNKISNVAVNIPNIKVPKPHVTVNIHQENDKIYRVDVENKEISNNENKSDNTEHFKDTFDPEPDKIENNIDNSKYIPNKNDNIENMENKEDNISNDSKDTIDNDMEIEKIKQKTCERNGIKQQHQRGTEHIKNDQIFANMGFIEPSLYFKKYNPPKANLNDYKMKGFNYSDYNAFIAPFDAGVKLLPKDNKKLYPKYSYVPKYPVSSGYVFKSSPALFFG